MILCQTLCYIIISLFFIYYCFGMMCKSKCMHTIAFHGFYCMDFPLYSKIVLFQSKNFNNKEKLNILIIFKIDSFKYVFS